MHFILSLSLIRAVFHGGFHEDAEVIRILHFRRHSTTVEGVTATGGAGLDKLTTVFLDFSRRAGNHQRGRYIAGNGALVAYHFLGVGHIGPVKHPGYPALEGAYNERLEYIGDFPKGWVSWMFDRTDMANAKRMIGDRCAISGNVPASLVVTGTPGEIKEYCRKLIETCAPGGGYTLNGGAMATEVKNPDNFRVFMEAAVEYGTY